MYWQDVEPVKLSVICILETNASEIIYNNIHNDYHTLDDHQVTHITITMMNIGFLNIIIKIICLV